MEMVGQESERGKTLTEMSPNGGNSNAMQWTTQAERTHYVGFDYSVMLLMSLVEHAIGC